MPEELLVTVAGSIVAAFAAAAAVLLLCGWPWRAPRVAFVSAGVVVGLGLAFYAGCLLFRPELRWPPREAQDRLLFVLFPAVLAVEFVGAFVRRPRAVVWLLRAGVAAGAARVLLHNIAYLKDLSGPDTAEWSPGTAALIFGGLAVALAVVWALLIALMTRAPGRAVPLALAITCLGAALVVMLSGYASGAMLGLPLAAGLAGVVAGSLVLPGQTDLRSALGPGVVGLFSLLVIAHYFSDLKAARAVLLFAAPLLCWVPELVPARGSWPRVRALARVALVAIPIVIVLVGAGKSFVESSRPSATANEPTDDDYSNYKP
jgi:hypothetical protein